MKTTITALETELIYYLETEYSYMDGWFFTNEIEISGVSKYSIAGIIGSLVKKGIVETDGQLITLVEA